MILDGVVENGGSHLHVVRAVGLRNLHHRQKVDLEVAFPGALARLLGMQALGVV